MAEFTVKLNVAGEAPTVRLVRSTESHGPPDPVDTERETPTLAAPDRVTVTSTGTLLPLGILTSTSVGLTERVAASIGEKAAKQVSRKAACLISIPPEGSRIYHRPQQVRCNFLGY